MSKNLVILIISILLFNPVLAHGEEFPPDFEEMLKRMGVEGEKVIKSDIDIKLSPDTKESKRKRTIKVKTLEKKVLKFEITADSEIEFSLKKSECDFCVIPFTSRQRTRLIDGKPGVYELEKFFEIQPRHEGEYQIVFKHNLFEEDFILTLKVKKGKMSFDEMIEEVGFEQKIKVGMSEEELREQISGPSSSSLKFKDGWQILYFYYPNANIGYQVLMQDGVVFDFKRIDMGKNFREHSSFSSEIKEFKAEHQE